MHLEAHKLQEILDSLDQPMMLLDPGLTIEWNNKTLISQYGDQRGKRCSDFLQPLSPFLDESSCIAKKTLADGLKHSGEFFVLTLPGGKRHYSVTSSAIFNQNGNMQSILLVFDDITHEKIMEQDLCQLQELNEEIITILPLGLILLDPKFRVCLWNPTMERMTLIPAQQINGQNILNFPPQMITPDLREVLEKVHQHSEPFFIPSYRQSMPNGSITYYKVSLFPLKGKNPEVQFLLICFEDITQHKSIEKELAAKAQKQARGIMESEKKFSTLVDNSLEGIAIIKDLNFTYLNHSLAALLGYKHPDELIGQSLKVVHPDDEQGFGVVQRRLEQKKQGKNNPPRFEIKAKKKDGTPLDLEISASDVRVEGETITLATFRDITEIKRKDEMEKNLHEHILHSDRLAAMGRFSAGIAHEINNPLAVVSGRIQELLVQYQSHPELARNFASMKRVCDRIAKIVDSLLFFAKQKEEPKYLYQINEVIEDAISMFEMETVNKGVRLVKEYGANLPPVVIIASQIQQVCVNMLINAIDATSVGDVITISTRLDRRGKKFLIIFKDTGCGISQEHMDKIFDPFFTTKGVGKGSGLGLSISLGIIKDHKGSIRVHSRLGAGTIFTIRIPLPTVEDLEHYGFHPTDYRA